MNPLHHIDAAEPLSVARLRDTIANVLTHAIGPDSVPLSDTKDVVVSVGDKIYPLSGVAIAFYGGRVVLELIAKDVPPCHYCGRIGNHMGDKPCPSWEQMHHGKQVGTDM